MGRRSVRLYLPRAARISGIVKPFDQLWVRGHSDFNHVGVRFHLEGPIVSAKQMMQFHFLLQDGTLWGVINTLRMDPSSNIPGATKKKKKKESHLGDKWTISLSEWRLRKTVQKCRFNDSPTLCSKIKSHLLLPPSWIFYTQTGWDIDSLMSTIKFPHCVLQPNLRPQK